MPELSMTLPLGCLMEAADEAKSGWAWKVLMIQPGLSKNRTQYSPELLKKSAPLFEGVRAMARSDADHSRDAGVHPRDVIGWFDGVHYAEGQGLVGNFHLTKDAAWLKDKLVSAYEAGKQDLLGFSIVASGFGRKVKQGDKLLTVVDELQEARFVDVVVHPSAGGRLLSIAEADSGTDPALSEVLMLEKLLKMIEARCPELAATIDKENVTEAELLDLMESSWNSHQEGSSTGHAAAPLAPTQPEPMLSQAGPYDIRLTEALQEVESISARLRLREALDQAHLPAPVQAKLEKQFTAEIQAGTYPSPSRLNGIIEAERSVLQALSEAGRIEGFGRTQAQVLRDETEQRVQQLDDFFDRKRGAVSFREAYISLTGDAKVTGRVVSLSHMEALQAYAIRAGLMVSESITTSGFDAILANTLHRRMVDEYMRSNFNIWREIVDVNPSLSDMRTQTRVRFGGYGDLPTVTESSNYLGLTSPSDESSTYTPAKRGGTESITLESIWNDDVQAIVRIPTRLARAAARTLYKFVFNTCLASNPTIYDSVALFHNDHSNLTSTAFSATQFMLHRVAMMSQTEAGSSEVLGIVPKFLLVPPELEEAAYNAFVRTTNNDAAFVQTVAPRILTISEWTDANNWFSICDPMDCPTIEIGFFDGEEPQLFRQDLPNVGSVFTNDSITWKIRHIYGGAVMDYRGMQGAIVA